MMANRDQREVELKLLLDGAADHDRVRELLDGLVPAEVATQDNLYLETTRLSLRAAGVMLRVRLSGAKAVLTVKGRATLVDGISRVDEFESDLEGESAAIWRPLGRVPRAAQILADGSLPARLRRAGAADINGDTTLHLLAAVRNTRRRYVVGLASFGLDASSAGAPLSIELDHTLYPGGDERFEMEVEDPRVDHLRDGLCAWLDRMDISWRLADRSKYKQLIDALDAPPTAAQSTGHGAGGVYTARGAYTAGGVRPGGLDDGRGGSVGE